MTTQPNTTRAYRDRHAKEMRRRRLHWLTALACTSSAVALTACGDPRPSVPAAQTEELLVYKSLEDCKAEQWDESLCDAAFADAEAARETQPAYARKEQCEAEYGAGNCETRTSGGNNWFFPVMAGFMMHSAMNRMSGAAYQDYKLRRQGGGAYPVYVNRDGQVSTYSGRVQQPLGYRAPGGRAGLPSRFNLQPDPSGRGYVAPGTYRAETRGGFGRTASFRGGCCG